MIILAILCLIFPQISISSAQGTIRLWYSSVLPVLFPFFIVCRTLYYSGGVKKFSSFLKPVMKFFGIPEAYAFPLAMSLMCGYPTGARCVASMHENGFDDIEFSGNLCYSSGPLFIIGTVGSVMLNNTGIGAALLTVHICTLIIFSLFLKPKQNNVPFTAKSGSIGNAISESIEAVLSICGYMVFFGLLSALLFYFLPPLPPIAKGIISGLFEFTSGIKILAESGSFFSLPLISFFLSFGGSCVIAQCLSQLKGINKFKFVFNRFACGTLSFLLTAIYQKTAVCVPIFLTLTAVIFKKIYCYFLKSSRS